MNKITGLIWLNIALLLIAWLTAFMIFDSLPDRYPIHFNFEGEPDRWGDKSAFEFFLLPGVLTLIIVLLLVLLRYPQYYNFPQKKEVRKWPEEYKIPVYNYLKQAVLIIGILLSLMFIYLQFMIAESAKSGVMSDSNIWVMILISVIWIPFLIIFLLRINKIVKKIRKKIDERTAS